MRKTTGVSYEGDKHEIAAIKQLADEKGVTAGNLIAGAVRSVYGDELAPLISFFRKRGTSKGQMASSKASEQHA